jgi:chromosome partitioning protein
VAIGTRSDSIGLTTLGPTICFINQKGGCGKSSTCFHLAGAFAQMGLKVLLIDADPQGSLSQGFLGPQLVETLEADETLAGAFDDSFAFHKPEQAVRSTSWPAISIVPANQCLTPFNVPHPERLGLEQFALQEFLHSMPPSDITLIDCPPNLYGCSWSALLASNYVIIPIPPEDFGAQGLRVVHQAIEHAQVLNPRLSLLGHLVTRYDRRLVVHRSYEQRLREIHGDTVLRSVIPEVSAFKVSLACRCPVGIYSPRTAAASLTSELGREILDHIYAANGFNSEAVTA